MVVSEKGAQPGSFNEAGFPFGVACPSQKLSFCHLLFIIALKINILPTKTWKTNYKITNEY